VSGSATRLRSTIVIVGVALVVTVGVETIFSGWSAVIPAEALELDASAAALGTTVFWSLMTVGRLLGWLALARGVTATVLGAVLAALAALALVAAALLRTDAPLTALAGAMVAVVAIAPLYSLLIGSALDRADPADASRLIGVLVAAGAVGGAVIPLGALFVGGAPSAPLVFALAGIGCAVLGALFAVIRRSPASTGTPASTGSPDSPRGDHA
jgi:fucose permease